MMPRLGSAARSGADVVLEVALGMGEVERAGDLDEPGAKRLGGLGKAHEFERRCRLGPHRDRGSSIHFLDDDRCHADAFIETHGREIAGRPAGKKCSVIATQPGIDEEPDVLPERGFVDFHSGSIREWAWEW